MRAIHSFLIWLWQGDPRVQTFDPITDIPDDPYLRHADGEIHFYDYKASRTMNVHFRLRGLQLMLPLFQCPK